MSSAALAPFRAEIDTLDRQLVALLAQRFQVVKAVVGVKKSHGLPAAIPERVNDVIASVVSEAERCGFPASTAEKIWRLLIDEMIAYEEQQLGARALPT